MILIFGLTAAGAIGLVLIFRVLVFIFIFVFVISASVVPGIRLVPMTLGVDVM